MARGVGRGEIRLYTFKPPDGPSPRPRPDPTEITGLLRTLMVAPITSKIRGAPGDVHVGVDEGGLQSAAGGDRVLNLKEI